MMKSLTYLLLIICLPITLEAQDNFKHGYVIIQKGDTVNLLINDKGDISNARRIQVRMLPDPQEEKFFNPDMIEAYHILPSRHYVSGEWEGKFLFFRAVVLGKLDLLVYKDENLNEHVFIRNGGNFVHLYSLERRYLADRISDHHEMVLLKKKVDEKLDSAFRDCEKVRRYIPYTEFKLMNIAKMVKAYNDCMGETVYFEMSLYSNRPDVKISVYTGVISSRVVVKDHGKAYFEQSEFRNRVGLVTGLNFDLHYKSWNPGLSLQFDVKYQQKGMQTRKGNVYTKVIGLPPVPLLIKFNLDYVNMGMMLKYRWTDRTISPYLSGGLTVGYLVNSLDEAYYATEQGERAGYIFDENNESPAEAGFLIEMGLNYLINKKMELFAGLEYENTTHIGESASSFSNRSGGIKVGVTF